MNSLISFVLHPLIPVNVGEDDEAGIDVVYPLTIFFAFGIWLVSHRYYMMHNSPVPFTVKTPHVCFNAHRYILPAYCTPPRLPTPDGSRV